MSLEQTVYDFGRDLKDFPREVYDYLKDDATQAYRDLKRQFNIALATPGSRAILRNPEQFAVIPYITEELIERKIGEVEASIIVGELEKYAVNEKNIIGKKFDKADSKLDIGGLVIGLSLPPFFLSFMFPSFFPITLGFISIGGSYMMYNVAYYEPYRRTHRLRHINEQSHDFLPVSLLDPTKIIIDREEQK